MGKGNRKLWTILERRPYFVEDNPLYFDKSNISKIIRNEYFSYLKSPNYFMLIFGMFERKYFPKKIKKNTKKNH